VILTKNLRLTNLWLRKSRMTSWSW
jgi:hypothetical protein